MCFIFLCNFLSGIKPPHDPLTETSPSFLQNEIKAASVQSTFSTRSESFSRDPWWNVRSRWFWWRLTWDALLTISLKIYRLHRTLELGCQGKNSKRLKSALEDLLVSIEFDFFRSKNTKLQKTSRCFSAETKLITPFFVFQNKFSSFISII